MDSSDVLRRQPTPEQTGAASWPEAGLALAGVGQVVGIDERTGRRLIVNGVRDGFPVVNFEQTDGEIIPYDQ